MNKSINKDDISKQTQLNRKKAIEIILSGEKTDNKPIKSIIDSVSQQSLDFTVFENKIIETPMSFQEIYDLLKEYKRGVIPVIIATIIKNNIKFAVVKKQDEEVIINSRLFEDIEENPHLYTLSVVKDKEKFSKYSNIFYVDKRGNNIFSNIVEGMQSWFFNLDTYSAAISKEYIGLGNYKELSMKTVRFKDSLRGIHKEPYWYLSEKLPSILGVNTCKSLILEKKIIESTIERLVNVLIEDIQTIFPENLGMWYEKLPNVIKQKIFKDGEENFFKLCSLDISKDENIKSIAKYLTGISVSNWDENTPSLFFKRLIEIKDIIEENNSNSITDGFVIKLIIGGTEKTQKYIDISNNIAPKTEDIFINDIRALFNDYGESIRHSDKITLLCKVVLEGVI